MMWFGSLVPVRTVLIVWCLLDCDYLIWFNDAEEASGCVFTSLRKDQSDSFMLPQIL